MMIKPTANFSNTFISELKRATRSRGFIIALLLGMLLLGLGLNYASHYPEEKSFVDQWYLAYNHSFYFQMLPLIACFPFADSLSSDRKQGYLERLAVRQTFKKVMSAKFIANAFAGALAAILPLLLLYAFTTLTNQNPINHPALNTVDGRPYEMQELVHPFPKQSRPFYSACGRSGFFYLALYLPPWGWHLHCW